MKKSFKRAGIAVLSMSMLLSMGAMTAITSNAALGDNVTITFPASQSGLKVYQVASATVENGVLKYTINTAYAAVLEVDATTGAVKAKAGILDTEAKTLNNVTSNSSEAQKLAGAILKKIPTTATATTIAAAGETKALAPGYYIVLANTTGESAAILLSVTDDSADATKAINSVKYSDVTFDKQITSVANATNVMKKDKDGGDNDAALAQVGDIIGFKIETSFPKYNPDSVKVVGDGTTSESGPDGMTSFIITDKPEDTIELKGLDDFSGITVKVAGTTVTSTDTVNTAAVGETFKIEKVDANTAAGTSAGFKITFDNAYVIKNPEAAVLVEFNGELLGNPDTGTDPNENNAYLSYSNNYDTAKGSYTPGTPPTPEKPEGEEPKYDEDKPKEEKDEVDIFCTLVNVNKQNENGNTLTGAEFALQKDSNGVPSGENYITGVADVTDAKFSFSGLKAGTYWIVETKAPTDYKKADPVKVVITDETTGDSYTSSTVTFNYAFGDGTKGTSNETSIKNYKGQVLPGTGGMGTVLFTVGGAAVVLLAGALFVVYMKKRKIKE